jgi:ferredoxin-NADP reductase
MNIVTPVASRTATANTLDLFVRQIRYEASGINSYELVARDAGKLPEVAAGAHIDIHLPNGMVRQYSLSNDPAEQHRFVISVLKDDAGHGGSRSLHETIHVQDSVRVSLPRNNFSLDEKAARTILIAGGIGITPLKAMCHRLAAIGADFVLHYCSKSPEHAAFREELAAWEAEGKVVFHFDGGDPARGLDIASMLKAAKAENVQVYYCGPNGFMNACANATSDWPADRVHCEHFKAPSLEPAAAETSNTGSAVDAFTVEIASTGQKIEVTAAESIADALHAAGVEIETSCISGLCGTCKTRYLAGNPDHRDFILSDEEHTEYLTA